MANVNMTKPLPRAAAVTSVPDRAAKRAPRGHRVLCELNRLLLDESWMLIASGRTAYQHSIERMRDVALRVKARPASAPSFSFSKSTS